MIVASMWLFDSFIKFQRDYLRAAVKHQRHVSYLIGERVRIVKTNEEGVIHETC